MGRLAYTKQQLEFVIKNSTSYSQALRLLKLCSTGNSHNTIKKYCILWGISTEHFNSKKNIQKELTPLEEILIVGSTYNRSRLKERLYQLGIKHRCCEICGQGEIWFNSHISLILDHINGIRDDNRLENLRIVCPNCNATLETHCSKNKSNTTMVAINRNKSVKLNRRTVERPPLEVLLQEIAELGFVKTGAKYNVSDNAIRKWLRTYNKYGI